jgi:hypothetical protein
VPSSGVASGRVPERFDPPDHCPKLRGSAGVTINYADAEAGIGYGYVTSQMGTSLPGDHRDVALRDALHSVIRSG